MQVSDIEVARKMVSIEKSAASRNIYFDVSFKRMKELLEAEKCFYTDIPFTATGTNQRSIDRVDNDLGYVDDNIVACNLNFNNKKSCLTLEEIRLMYHRIFNSFKIDDINPGIVS